MSRIKKAKIDNSRITKPTDIKNIYISFSFKYLDTGKDKFCIKSKDGDYFNKLIERLQGISTYTPLDLIKNNSKSLRFHPIDFKETSEPEGFKVNNEIFNNQTAYQIAISANKHGRIHGFFIDSVFFIIWFDPEHKLYST